MLGLIERLRNEKAEIVNMSPPAEDEPDFPDSEGDEDSDNMTEIRDHPSSDEKSPDRAGNEPSVKPTAKSNAKDPSRPRRKKARRACFACQRAHLTCG